MDTMVTASEWAKAEFGAAELGDPRRTRRLVKVVEALAHDPHGTVHRVMSDWADLMGAYRLVGSSAVSFERITDAHHRRTRQRCSEPGDYVMIEDTTALDFTRHWATEGLGRIGDNGGRGFYLHSTLALRVESWTKDQDPQVSVAGLLAQHGWARTTPSLGSTRESKKSRFRRPRESQRWADSFIRDGGPLPGIRWTLIADREADNRGRLAGMTLRYGRCAIGLPFDMPFDWAQGKLRTSSGHRNRAGFSCAKRGPRYIGAFGPPKADKLHATSPSFCWSPVRDFLVAFRGQNA
jgi:hypothetical protein